MLNLKILMTGLVITIVNSFPYHNPQILSPPLFDIAQDYRQIDQRAVTYNKHFHFFASPEESERYAEVLPEDLLRPNIRVVVIKAPENNRITSAISRLMKTFAQGKTAIYVLSKEPDLDELTSQITKLNEQKNEEKPEVHFIKYKTDEEAELAKINIQSEYKSLKGSTKVNIEEAGILHSLIERNEEIGREGKSESPVSSNDDDLINLRDVSDDSVESTDTQKENGIPTIPTLSPSTDEIVNTSNEPTTETLSDDIRTSSTVNVLVTSTEYLPPNTTDSLEMSSKKD